MTITPQETTEIGNRERVTSRKTPLPTPYTYIQINGDPKLEKTHKDLPTTKKINAHYGTGEVKPADAILKEAQRAAERSSLHSEYWREKGLPTEQVTLTIVQEGATREINIYNYNESNLLTEDHLQIIQETLKKIAVRFPWLANRINILALDNEGRPSLMDDEIRFPYSGTPMTGGIHLFPRALDLSIALGYSRKIKVILKTTLRKRYQIWKEQLFMKQHILMNGQSGSNGKNMISTQCLLLHGMTLNMLMSGWKIKTENFGYIKKQGW